MKQSKNAVLSYRQINDDKFLELSDKTTQSVPIEQTPLWGKFDNSIPGRRFLGSFVYKQNSKPVALVSATLYKETGRNWIWIKHGPLFFKTPSKDLVMKLCATLKQQFDMSEYGKPLFLRLSLPQKLAGLRLPFEHTMYDQTVVVDLDKSETELMASFSQSGRQGIRKAVKANVKIEQIQSTNALKNFRKEFYPILSETSSRGGFGIHPAELYEAMLKNLSSNIRLYGAYFEGKVCSWAIVTEYDQQALYYYGASNSKARDSHAPYLLHWEIIKDLKKRGNKTYDFMGIAGKNYPSLKNVTQFKLKFSKNIVNTPLAYDLPLQSTKYQLITKLLKLKRRLK